MGPQSNICHFKPCGVQTWTVAASLAYSYIFHLVKSVQNKRYNNGHRPKKKLPTKRPAKLSPCAETSLNPRNPMMMLPLWRPGFWDSLSLLFVDLLFSKLSRASVWLEYNWHDNCICLHNMTGYTRSK